MYQIEYHWTLLFKIYDNIHGIMNENISIPSASNNFSLEYNFIAVIPSNIIRLNNYWIIFWCIINRTFLNIYLHSILCYEAEYSIYSDNVQIFGSCTPLLFCKNHSLGYQNTLEFQYFWKQMTYSIKAYKIK